MTKQDLIKMAKKTGVLLVDQGDSLDIFVPAGKCIATTQCHHQHFWMKGYSRPEIYEEIARDLRMGLIDCTDCTQSEDCEYCEETKQNGLIPFDISLETILYNPEAQKS